MSKEKIISEIVEKIKSKKIKDRTELEIEKKILCKKYNSPNLVSNADIITKMKELNLNIPEFLIKKPMRTLSGVAVIAVMVEPHPCPGTCIYCPSSSKAPRSYTGFEPAALRGRSNKYDPYTQVKDRLHQFEVTGHPTDKIELIIMGGTFLSMKKEYKDWFVKRVFDALNNTIAKNLEEAKKINETAKHRCVALTIETRPDYCKKEHVIEMLKYGATRCEIGVQNPDDELYKLNKRGHTVQDVIDSTYNLKQAGLKVCYHLMPGMPYSNPERDLKNFKKIFEDENFRPDMLKIYPCLLLKEEYYEDKTVHDLYKKGLWIPYDEETAIKVITEIKKIVPKYVRIMRIQRDIPSQYVFRGVKATNLRQLVHKKMEELGIKCRCIRCREIKDLEPKDISLDILKYRASKGDEYFISFEDKIQDKIIGYIRLRIPDEKSFLDYVPENSCFIRELKVFGRATPIGMKKQDSEQHKGFGRKLLEKAEEIAKERGIEHVFIISGIGVREYYRKFGYDLKGYHMYKKLN